MPNRAPLASEAQIADAASLGVRMTGEQHNYIGEAGQKYLDEVYSVPALAWNDPDLARITCLRLLSDPGFPMWDVSYCHGERKDGHACNVILPFDQLPKRRMYAAIVEYAKRDHVFAKRLGILDNISTLQ